MGITTISYLLFATAVFLVYFMAPKAIRWFILLVASFIFYWICSGWLVAYLVVSILSTYAAALLVQRDTDRTKSRITPDMTKEEKARLKKSSTNRKKGWIALSVVLNFGILIVLKYGNFLITATSPLLDFFSIGPIPAMDVVLPLGISFYTLQSVSYCIDVYRGKYLPDRNPLKLALFVSFFPQMVQGPIGRYDELSKTLFQPHSFQYDRVKEGVLLIGWGFIKKLVVADRIGVLVTTVFGAPNSYSGSIIFLAALVYNLQIYTDFSGGIDIVRGVSRILGVDLAKNFSQPYFAVSISDFWRRWHITLGAWMREYIFFPLSISKPFAQLSNRLRKHWGGQWAKAITAGFISFFVFTLVGLWHGAEMKYLYYGFWNGGIIMISMFFAPLFKKILGFLHIPEKAFWFRLFQMGRTLILVTLGRVIVCSRQSPYSFIELKKILNPELWGLERLSDGTFWKLGLEIFDVRVVCVTTAILLLIDICLECGRQPLEWIARMPLIVRWLIYFLMIAALILLPAITLQEQTFIYERF